ncbi:DUF1778 domain-containing protein [Pseudomonas haemolytica]|uniref:DUF1778 domain-containing protein n=1 Tax=Pseudomonas haemolytica TaxID=2600065 RepID=A0A646NU49_9PSED|nr:DUF1778 domain-containing protein [Pseudomonas haemolytica]MRJ19434.1 DUF1778 domain-containing protein [Pseudomonas haemolytica]MRJ19437.1 DUF1778 domain-containing protein [Pseudomonas haemolytica]MRJ23688.1 DUF1778 domain-containing protein [Pseudomonas haemolytica]
MTELFEALKAPKTARLEIKTTDIAKETIRKAANLSGLDMTSFIMSSAFERAEAVLENHRRIEVSEKTFARLQEVLNEDKTAKPTKALINLMRGTYEIHRDRRM